ncbi:hypothetical protein H310_03585 [Aphanomyces invadans]|uniref:Uncharacterized protein n=1 Tax=Aphanomyces invadans TaxID=157072 RepID=A0A024UJD7_9STRA|nr:hypothetical protein H310_03585 [Aphanomyces invadans]ETW05952.1 hypothetical protein H310_03585 [Aphanomyces invadans]|eukprot:XP_008865729.1 hypothetical protein H310_03585 [Aphanomyces invadans]
MSKVRAELLWNIPLNTMQRVSGSGIMAEWALLRDEVVWGKRRVSKVAEVASTMSQVYCHSSPSGVPEYERLELASMKDSVDIPTNTAPGATSSAAMGSNGHRSAATIASHHDVPHCGTKSGSGRSEIGRRLRSTK